MRRAATRQIAARAFIIHGPARRGQRRASQRRFSPPSLNGSPAPLRGPGHCPPRRSHRSPHRRQCQTLVRRSRGFCTSSRRRSPAYDAGRRGRGAKARRGRQPGDLGDRRPAFRDCHHACHPLGSAGLDLALGLIAKGDYAGATLAAYAFPNRVDVKIVDWLIAISGGPQVLRRTPDVSKRLSTGRDRRCSAAL